jgi:hypothetical protein
MRRVFSDFGCVAIFSLSFQVGKAAKNIGGLLTRTQFARPVQVAFFRGPDGELVELLEE